MQIGPYTLNSPLILAPMAGFTDLPFRRLCRRFGAGMTVSEMVTSDTGLWHSRKSHFRLQLDLEAKPCSVQIAGADPKKLAEAARQCVQLGAHIIDINMGCPAKKVCNVLAGSSLLKDEKRVGDILDAVVAAVTVPVTLKIRTGWDRANKNALTIAKIAADAGIQALAVHGRTRADRFTGQAEYETIRLIKQNVDIPIIANGDIDSAEKTLGILKYTQADGLMIGRAAQGNPWIFQEINNALTNTGHNQSLSFAERGKVILQHLESIYEYYGKPLGARIARKHLACYFKAPQSSYWREVCQIESASDQYRITQSYISSLLEQSTIALTQSKHSVAA